MKRINDEDKFWYTVATGETVTFTVTGTRVVAEGAVGAVAMTKKSPAAGVTTLEFTVTASGDHVIPASLQLIFDPSAPKTTQASYEVAGSGGGGTFNDFLPIRKSQLAKRKDFDFVVP